MRTTSPALTSRAHQWEIVRDVHEANYLPTLTGTLGTGATAAARVGSRAARYLPMRDQGENLDAYEYAVRLVEPGGLLAYTAASLAGQIAAAEAEIDRAWSGESPGIFGDPEDPTSEAARLWADADGEGTNWAVFWRKLTTNVILYQDYYLVVDGTRNETLTTTTMEGEEVETEIVRRPSVRILPPWCAEEPEYVAGRLTRITFRTVREEDDEEVVDTYTLTGQVRTIGEERTMEPYAYYDDTARTVPRLPVYRVRLPLETYHAHLWARKELSIVNMRMRLDAMLNLGNSPRLVRIKGEHEIDPASTGETGSRTANEIMAGGRYHELGNGGSMSYVEPSMSASAFTAERLDAKRRDFREEAFHLMADEARQVTATEVRQRSSSGTDAILSLISSSIEEGENQAFFLLAQAIAPDNPTGWREASVTRSEDFVAFDAAERAGAMTEAVFGPDAIPVGPTAQRSAAERWCEAHGLTYEPDEIEAAVEDYNTRAGSVSPARRAHLSADLSGDVPDLAI